MKSVLAALSMLLALPFGITSAHETDGDHALEIADVWARKTRRTVSAAVYMTLRNNTGAAETLRGVSTPRAANVMLHLSQEIDGIMRMEMQETVDLPVGATVSFEPGGLHVMLMGLSEPLVEGTVFPLTLSFDNAGEVTVYVEVTGLNGPTTKQP